MSKLSKNEQRKLKDHYIINTFGDRKLADLYRNRSYDRIKNELGLDLKNKRKIPDLITRDKKVRAKKEKHFINLRGNMARGYTVEESFKSRHRKSLPFRKLKGGKAGSIVTDRADNWGDWSRDQNIPIRFESFAKKVNRQEGLKSHEHYGYAILYFMYVENYSFAEAQSIVQYDPEAVKGLIYSGSKRALA